MGESDRAFCSLRKNDPTSFILNDIDLFALRFAE